MLIVIGGLPAVGKSTIAYALATELGATYLRADTIEQAIRDSGQKDIGPVGYMVAYRVAAENLKLGRTVVADMVNPLFVTRQAWRAVASEAGTDVLEVEIVCSDLGEHRRRAESRRSDIHRLTLPTWTEIQTREYETWDLHPLRLDSAKLSVEESVAQILQRLIPDQEAIDP